MGSWPSSQRGTRSDSGLLCYRHQPWSLPLPEVLGTRLTPPFSRSQALVRTTTGFTLYQAMLRSRSRGRRTSPRSQTRVAAGHGRLVQEVVGQPQFTSLTATGFTKPTQCSACAGLCDWARVKVMGCTLGQQSIRMGRGLRGDREGPAERRKPRPLLALLGALAPGSEGSLGLSGFSDHVWGWGAEGSSSPPPFPCSPRWIPGTFGPGGTPEGDLKRDLGRTADGCHVPPPSRWAPHTEPFSLVRGTPGGVANRGGGVARAWRGGAWQAAAACGRRPAYRGPAHPARVTAPRR